MTKSTKILQQMARAERNGTKWLTTGQVASACGVCPSTVRKWIDGGLLKGHLVPGSKHRRVAEEALDELRKMVETL